MSTLTSMIGDKVSQAADQADSLSRETAGNLYAAASSVRKAAATAAEKLEEVGCYVKKYNLGKAVGQSKKMIRQYPAELVAIAAGVGFLSGIAIMSLGHVSSKRK
jgi:ElaB/YqjD/DUF883 family membrane-anchored ribosome-binding protein